MKMSLAMKILAACAWAILLPSLTFAQYTRTDLVTNSGAGGTVQDSHLVNAWGLVSTTTSPFWVSDNATGLSTLYSISNKTGVSASPLGLVVSVPAVSGGQGTPTGIVAPETPPGVAAFVISGINPITGMQASGNAAFIFATLDGTISGWNPAVGGISATGASTATLAADRSSVGATYTGLAIATNNGQRFLYAAADGQNRRVDVFNSNFQLTDLGPNAFVDPTFRRNSLLMAFRRSPRPTAHKRLGSPIRLSTKLRVVLWPPSPQRAFCCLTLHSVVLSIRRGASRSRLPTLGL